MLYSNRQDRIRRGLLQLKHEQGDECLTNTFTGIGQGDVPGFLLAQGAAVVVAVRLFAWIFRERSKGSG